MYVSKTWRRLEQWKNLDPLGADIMDRDEVVLNGRSLLGMSRLRAAVVERARALQASATVTVMHGDFCFSNILFDVSSQVLRLIDPRGSFGATGIFGDPRYDIAKLRHSICGLYDYIVADLFSLERTDEGEMRSETFAGAGIERLCGSFDGMAASAGYNMDDIRFIEGLLFVSMPPLHRGHPLRQEMMFLTGLQLLNRTLK
jgi:hypothetical protein